MATILHFPTGEIFPEQPEPQERPKPPIRTIADVLASLERDLDRQLQRIREQHNDRS